MQGSLPRVLDSVGLGDPEVSAVPREGWENTWWNDRYPSAPPFASCADSRLETMHFVW